MGHYYDKTCTLLYLLIINYFLIKSSQSRQPCLVIVASKIITYLIIIASMTITYHFSGHYCNDRHIFRYKWLREMGMAMCFIVALFNVYELFVFGNVFKKMKKFAYICISLQHWDCAGNWNNIPSKTGSFFILRINDVASEDVAIGARQASARVFILFWENIPASKSAQSTWFN